MRPRIQPAPSAEDGTSSIVLGMHPRATRNPSAPDGMSSIVRAMHYDVKTDSGELTFASMAELRRLYEQGFVSPDDLVRAEGSATWVRAGRIASLRGAQPRSRIESRMAAILALTIAFSVVVGAAAFGYKKLALAGLVAIAAILPFTIYRRRS